MPLPASRFRGRVSSKRPLLHLLLACWWRALLLESRHERVVEQVDKSITKQRGDYYVYLSSSLSTSRAVGGWSNWAEVVAHVLPTVTSDRPLCSPRGERELAVVSLPSMSPRLILSEGRKGQGRVARSVCSGLMSVCPLLKTRSDPGRLSFNYDVK